MSDVLPIPDPILSFSSFNKFWAIHHTKLGEQTLLWESRVTADEKRTLYTIYEGQEIRVNSINEFLLSNPDCMQLSISHDVRVLWNGTTKPTQLTECFCLQSESTRVVIKLRLVIDNIEYQTEECDTLTESILELEEMIDDDIKWWIKTCYHCNYSRPAFLFPVSDRDEMRCYRDVPNAFMEVKQKGKFANTTALQAGHYFVDAFHSCAAWTSDELS